MADEFAGAPRAVGERTVLKMLALVLAFACWYMIREETSYEQTIRGIGVEIKPPPGKAIRLQSVQKADVVVRGSRADIRELASEDLLIELDMRKTAVSDRVATLRMSPKHVHVPPGVRVVHVDPQTVRVEIDAAKTP